MPDALKTYKAKRNFNITPEPADGGEQIDSALSFVIQKHWASRLHYDFRLEFDGAMKSWAVPKGPSYDSKDRRMAVHVEDHPIAYSSFEGIIPERQYGAGKVIVWDKGTWLPRGDPHKGYAAGNLKFELHGHKMHGKWVLVRLKRSGEKQEPWLLIKEKDEFARPAGQFSVVDEMPDSVASLPAPAPAPNTALKVVAPAALPDAKKAELPATLAPQLATLVDGPPATPDDWLFELKFDGYRLLTRIEGENIRLFTRNGHDWTYKLQPLRAALAKMALPPGWYDGEIVVNDAQGRPDFGALQQAFDSETNCMAIGMADRGQEKATPMRSPKKAAPKKAAPTIDILYFLFDIPYFDGYDLRHVPLEARREILQAALDKAATSPSVRFSAQFDAPPKELMAAACKLGLEGVIGKRRSANYVSRRSPDWIKLKCAQRQEFVIGGYTDPQGSRTGIGALLLGTHDERGQLRYAGKVGTGFSQAALHDLKERLTKLASDNSPFASGAGIAQKPHWVKPELLAEVSFAEWTGGGVIRHSVFHGLRSVKKPTAITREVSQHAKATVDRTAVKGTLPATLKVSNAERIIDAVSGVTKMDLVRYYALVGSLMMVHLKGRPVTLLRAPSGVIGKMFFQKHADTAKLPGIGQLDAALDQDHQAMLEVATTQGVLAAAQWNVVEFHTQNAFANSYETPNRMVFDLDPGQGVTWRAIQDGAMLMRAFLNELGLPAFLKTSGGKGLHVVVPIKPLYDWDTVKAFSQSIVAHLAKTIPDRFVLKSGPTNRVGKIFIDYLRNGRGATTVCAWSARARPGLGISVPVDWDELASLKGGDHWNVGSVHTCMDQGNAPWSAYSRSAKSLWAAMKQLGFQAANADKR